MIATAHLAAGAVATVAAVAFGGGGIRRVAAGFVFGVLSHMALDAVPHSDYLPLPQDQLVAPVLAETVVVTLALAWLLRTRLYGHWPVFVAGLAGAALPDAKFLARPPMPDGMAELVWNYGIRFHDFFHAPRPSIAFGWITQVGSILLLLALLVWLARAERRPATVRIPGSRSIRRLEEVDEPGLQ